jgi:hypothetical protein
MQGTPNFLDLRIMLSRDEYAALIGLLDLGVKSGGLQVAAAAAVLQQKFDMALQGATRAAEEARTAATRAAEAAAKLPHGKSPAPAAGGANGAAHTNGAAQPISPPSAA